MTLNNKNIVLYALLIIAVTTITYSNHFHNSFHFDDSHTIENNIYIKSLKNIPLFFKDAGTFSSLPPNQTYRPLVSTSLAIDHHLAGGLQNTFYFHLSEFIWFLLQGLLMYFFYRAILKNESNATAVSLFAVTWYMLHPACAETINYIIARSDLISTLFVVLAFVMYAYSSFSKKWHLYLLPIIVGSLAKISVLVFAPLLFCYHLLIEQQAAFQWTSKENKTSTFLALKKSLPSFILCVVLYLFIRGMDKDTWVPGGTSTMSYMITQPYVIMQYFFTFFAPIHLSADTDLTAFPNILNVKFFIGLAFILLLFITIIYTSRKKSMRIISFGLCWFMIALLPTSSIIPFAEVMNDHRVFFPYVGLALAVVKSFELALNFILQKFSIHKNILIAFAILFLSAYAYGTHQRNEIWKTEESLWKDVTVKSPDNGRGHMNYGLTQMAKGNYSEALKEFSTTLKLWPNYPYAHVNMGILKDAMGKSNEAEPYFQNAIALNPGLPECYFYYARYLAKQGKTQLAINGLIKALQIAPAHINSRYLLMDLLLKEGKFDELKQIAEATLEILPGDKAALSFIDAANAKGSEMEIVLKKINTNPTPEAYLELSLIYYKKGDYINCINACNQALSLNPNYTDAFNNICSAFNQLKEWDKAMDACNEALKIDSANALAKNNLAWAQLNRQMQPK